MIFLDEKSENLVQKFAYRSVVDFYLVDSGCNFRIGSADTVELFVGHLQFALNAITYIDSFIIYINEI